MHSSPYCVPHNYANDRSDFYTYSSTIGNANDGAIGNANKRAQFFTHSNANEGPDFFADKYAYL